MSTQAVAIVGIGCRFPGGVEDVEGFWQLLRDGVDAITEIPVDRIDLAHYFDPRPAIPGRIMTRWGGFLKHIQEFDAAFFGISPREAERLDPQQRLLLEVAWEGLEDAGQDIHRLEGSKTSVFIGQWLSDFEARLFADPELVDFQMTTGSGRYAASGRISYAFGFRGPSLTIDTACSSSLAAVHLAVRSIRSGESDMALAGGVNVILQPQVTIAYSQSRMMAPDGHCKFGSADGDGYVRSEGAGIVVLKRLDKALAEGDRVYAIIRGSALNNDGRSSGSMGTPSRLGQEELLRSAYLDAGVSPGCVGYVEAHGTGTRAGDPVELGALAAVLGESRKSGYPAFVGSVKTNMGHTEGAAGIAGLIKLALVLHKGSIPPSLHCRELNPVVDWSGGPLRLVRALQPWVRGAGVRVGGVSAFGIAGTNAHVVLEESPGGAGVEASNDADPPTAVLPLSANDPQALRELAGRYARLLARGKYSLPQVGASAATRRAALEHRAVFIATSLPVMIDLLERFAVGEPTAAAAGHSAGGARLQVAWVLPGQGGQFPGMARELLAHDAAFGDCLQRCDRAAQQWLGLSIIDQLRSTPGSPGYRLDDIDVIQPVLVALALAYAATLRSRGIEADAVVGHSMGEVGAACLAGALTEDRAMEIICRRSALLRTTSGRGAMALVELPMAEAAARIRGQERLLAIAVSNSPRSSVVSGEPEAVRGLLDGLAREEIFCRLIKVDVASHSPQMDPLAAELALQLAGLLPDPLSTRLYSTVFAREAQAHELGASYWARNMRDPVMFGPTIAAMREAGINAFIELGPHPVLLPSIQQAATGSNGLLLTSACGRRDESGMVGLLGVAAGLWAAGADVKWERWLPANPGWVDLPAYPWQRERHWLSSADARSATSGLVKAPAEPDEQSLEWLYRFEWPSTPWTQSSTRPEHQSQRWLLVSAEPSWAEALSIAIESNNAGTARHVPLGRLESVLRNDSGSPSALTQIVVLAQEMADTAYLPLQVLQMALHAGARADLRLWFVTRGAQSVDSKAGGPVEVEQAALWGCARVVAEEHPQLWGGLIDLDPEMPIAECMAPLARQLLTTDDENQTALRGPARHVLRLARAKLPAVEQPFNWRGDASYLITGGLGGIGLHIARSLAARGVRHLILLSRSGLPPRSDWSGIAAGVNPQIAAVRELEAGGVTVHIAAVDAADGVQLKDFLQRFAAEAWPPIRGVIHAAGIFDNHLAARMSAENFAPVMRAKLHSARLLDRLLPELDVFVLFSSTGAFLAQPGQANYAAANAGLDALAIDRRARGAAALSIAWGVWDQTGLVKNSTGRSNVAEMARQGIHAFDAGQGVTLFNWLCGRVKDATLCVLPMDWATFGRARSGRNTRLYDGLLSAAATSAKTNLHGDRLAVADPAQRRAMFETVVREAVGSVLKISPAKINVRKALGSMGLNSLMAMELRNRLEAELSVALSATLAWNYPTVEAMASHLSGTNEPVAQTRAPGGAADTVSPAGRWQDIVGLSDEDAAQALRATRRRPAR